jgi:hypothetical protein
MSARSEESLVPAMKISIFVVICFDIGAVLTGMAGRLLHVGTGSAILGQEQVHRRR